MYVETIYNRKGQMILIKMEGKNENFKETMEEFRRVSDCGSYDCADNFYVRHVVSDEYGSGISGRELYGAWRFADRKGAGI